MPRQLTMATVDVGIVCENISVAAAGLGLAAHPRGTMDSEGISKLLGLNENQLPIMNNVVGYPSSQEVILDARCKSRPSLGRLFYMRRNLMTATILIDETMLDKKNYAFFNYPSHPFQI